MPYQVFNTIGDLFSYIVANIGPNGNKEITGTRHQEVLVSTAYTLLNLMLILPDDTIMEFEPWNNSATYEPGDQVIVRHEGKLWLFVSDTDDTGTEPGTDATVWRELSSIELAHIRNRDQALDEGGPYEVTAQQLHALLNAGPPDLFSVLGVSVVGNPGYEHNSPMAPVVEQVTHASAGARVLDLSKAALQVNATASVELDYGAGPYRLAEWWVEVRNNSGGSINLTFATGKWKAADGVTVPATLASGAKALLRVKFYHSSLVVIDCHATAGLTDL